MLIDIYGFYGFSAPSSRFPQHHRAAAILVFGDGAFEVAGVQRMVLTSTASRLSCGSGEGPLATAQDLNTPSSSRRRS